MMFIIYNFCHFIFCLSGIAVVQVKKVMDKNSPKQVSTAVENMLKTGRLVTQTGLDLQQVLACQCLVKLSIVCNFVFASFQLSFCFLNYNKILDY